MHTCRVYTKDCVDPTHIGRDISSCCYLRMLSYHHHHHWYLWIYPFFVSFSWHQIDSYLEHSNGDTFACAFDALHEPFRNIWLVPLCLVHATRNNKRGENYSTTTKLGIHHTLFWVGAEGGLPNFWVLLHFYALISKKKKNPNFSSSRGPRNFEVIQLKFWKF